MGGAVHQGRSCEMRLKFRFQYWVCMIARRITLYHNRKHSKWSAVFERWADKAIETGKRIIKQQEGGAE